MSDSSLSSQVARQLLEHIRENRLSNGQHLPAQTFADLFKVSRAPVTAALRLLEELQIVRLERHRGYFLVRNSEDLKGFEVPGVEENTDGPYFAIAEDRLSGRLPERVSENELMRTYGLSRGRVTKILHRIADEGWGERRQGHGWQFRETLTSAESYRNAYRFRAALESAAVLEPSFTVDDAAFKIARARQQALLDGELLRLPRPHLFQINTQFHEMIVACSRNEFFIDSIRRINRLRRLIEYRLAVDRSRLARQCHEHLEILDRLEGDSRADAAAFLRRHIEGAIAVKSSALT